MNDKLKILLKEINRIKSKEEFYNYISQFFEENFKDLKSALFKVSPFPPYYLKIIESHFSDYFLNIMFNTSKFKKSQRFFEKDELLIYSFGNSQKPESFIVFDKVNKNNVKEIQQLCEIIEHIFTLISENYNHGFNHSALQNANLISQLCHDTNSLVTSIKADINQLNQQTVTKIEFMEKMTKDILQFVREVAILNSEVKISELLDGIINKIEFPNNIEISNNYGLSNKTIKADVELIDRAIYEIIDNSIFALKGKKGKIHINSAIKYFGNIFYGNEYLIITIEDNGQKINSDFLPFLKNPYFTTWKSENHSGLGLAIADRIINAHGGFLTIEQNSEGYKRNRIYLPLKGLNNE